MINPKNSEFNFEWQAHDEDDARIKMIKVSKDNRVVVTSSK